MISPSTNYCQHIEELSSLDISAFNLYIETMPNDLSCREEKILYAATIEYLCNLKNITKPKWIEDKNLTSSTPIFACDTQNKDFQQFLIDTTPVEFANRNIFYGNQLLRRI